MCEQGFQFRVTDEELMLKGKPLDEVSPRRVDMCNNRMLPIHSSCHARASSGDYLTCLAGNGGMRYPL